LQLSSVFGDSVPRESTITLPTGVGESVQVAVRVGVLVDVAGVGVTVDVGMVGVDVDVGNVGVGVGDPGVGVAVLVGVSVPIAVGVVVAVGIGVDVGVHFPPVHGVGVRLGVVVLVGVGVIVAVASGVTVGVLVEVGLAGVGVIPDTVVCSTARLLAVMLTGAFALKNPMFASAAQRGFLPPELPMAKEHAGLNVRGSRLNLERLASNDNSWLPGGGA
jgi:hypothetical protein